jgi:hypothetical protein
MPTKKSKSKPRTSAKKKRVGVAQERLVQRWGRLRFGNIVGVVDSYGAVHSEFTGDDIAFHAEHFPQHHCQWRWNHAKSIWWITAEHKPNEEQYDAIMRHLTRKYGIEWWENGHHDIDHLQAKWREEDSSLNTSMSSPKERSE